MKIKVVKEFNHVNFAAIVNKNIEEGWELFGDPKIETIVSKDMWDGTERSSNVYTIYHQTLKKKNE